MVKNKVIKMLADIHSSLDVRCFCGSRAKLCSNSILYNYIEYGNGLAWICERFPVCRGSVGCHANGKPLGVIADSKTKALRLLVHAEIDRYWKCVKGSRNKKSMRNRVYAWLRKITGKSCEDCHVGRFTAQDCLDVLRLAKKYPFNLDNS